MKKPGPCGWATPPTWLPEYVKEGAISLHSRLDERTRRELESTFFLPLPDELDGKYGVPYGNSCRSDQPKHGNSCKINRIGSAVHLFACKKGGIIPTIERGWAMSRMGAAENRGFGKGDGGFRWDLLSRRIASRGTLQSPLPGVKPGRLVVRFDPNRCSSLGRRGMWGGGWSRGCSNRATASGSWPAPCRKSFAALGETIPWWR